jgi:hypothetical protein
MVVADFPGAYPYVSDGALRLIDYWNFGTGMHTGDLAE